MFTFLKNYSTGPSLIYSVVNVSERSVHEYLTLGWDRKCKIGFCPY